MRVYLNGTKYLNGIRGFKWHMPFKSFMSLTKTRIFLNDMNDLNDINGKPRGKLAGLLVLFKKNGTKYLNGIKGFKWYVPFK